MFLGEYHHALDEKGRIAIPTKFRAALKKGAVVTRGLDGSLVLYTADAWKSLAQKLAALPISKQTSRAFARLMLAGAMDVGIDGQGRITIPEYLRTYASMKKNVVVAGLFNRLELWDEAAWDVYKKKTEAAGADIAEQLGELNI
ncbi:division/cell wall cluster transcriptional repressor MraZ [Candidatus Uhrbacteria bacterium]|nr:division/cell wall cluster transcriptional repressor MraZ [Candidatus Uhrbacteria bacterium]